MIPFGTGAASTSPTTTRSRNDTLFAPLGTIKRPATPEGDTPQNAFSNVPRSMQDDVSQRASLEAAPTRTAEPSNVKTPPSLPSKLSRLPFGAASATKS
jgi:hypothetical protein